MSKLCGLFAERAPERAPTEAPEREASARLGRRHWLALAALGFHGLGQAASPLRVAWDDYPPYQTVISAAGKAKLQGLDIELAERIAARAGLALAWIRMPWSRQLASLQDGSLDLMLAASKAPEREPYALWTEPYRPERAALMGLTQPAQGPASLLTLRGQRIGLIRGATYPGELAEAMHVPSFRAQLQPLRHAEQGIRMLRERRLDYLIDDPVTLNHLARRDGLPKLMVVRWLMRGHAHLMLSRKAEAERPGLRASLNAAISALRKEGALATMWMHYPDLAD